MQYEWLHSHALIHVQTINQRIIYHSKPSSVIQLHVEQTNHRIQIKILTCLLQLLKMISSSVYKQANISTPVQTILFTEALQKPVAANTLRLSFKHALISNDLVIRFLRPVVSVPLTEKTLSTYA